MLGVLRASQWGHGLMRLFTTDHVDPGHRVEYWGALASDTICPTSVSGVRNPAAFAGRLWISDIALSTNYRFGVFTA